MKNWPSEKELKRVREKLKDSIASKMLAENASISDKAKFKVCEKFIIYLRENKLSQRELALKLEINESLVSKIVHYHFERFSLDKLLDYLAIIYPRTDFSIEVA